MVSVRVRRARAALAGVLIGLMALPALPAAVAAQEPPAPDPAPPATEPADPGADPSDPPPDTLDAADREALAEAEGDDVTLLVAAEDGRVDDAARQLRSLGAQVEVVEEDVDYLKATLPAEDAVRASKVPAVEAADVDRLIDRGEPGVDGTQAPTPQTPPGPGTPAVNPYLPSGDIGAPQFVAANPSFDGRGTVVAILDSGVDLDSEALSTTTTDGQPKIVEWHNANPPGSGDGTWVTTTGRHNGTFTAASRTWTAPDTGGPYSVGVLSETSGDLGAGNSETGGDLDRDGVRGETFGVLQDRSTREVRVDVDQDGDFTDEAPMRDLRDGNRDVGFFGTDDTATPERDRMAFVVGTDDSNTDPDSSGSSAVNIGIAGARHGTHVAGIATGHDLLGGTFDGVAPGAQVMAVKVCLTTPSCTSSGIVDGVVHAAANGADVANLSVGGPSALNDGSDARIEIIERAIDEYDMQLVGSAGNSGPGANSVGGTNLGLAVLTVGASITDATWRSNYGSDSASPSGLIPFTSQGPREDGGFKPDVVAPGSAIATTPPWQPGLPVGGTYALPPGYGHLNGTSMAAPQVAGAAALLVGAYKATHGGARPDPAALRAAFRESAEPIPGVPVHEQGMGLVDVAAAWTRLQAGYAPHDISASVPSGSPLADRLTTPGRGLGIYERTDMVAGGPDRVRTYTVTRTSGPTGTVVARVSWIGNDGTFSAPSHVSLPRGTPVSVPVTIRSTTAGAHSAAMVLDDPATTGLDLVTMNAAFVGEPLVDGTATLTGTVPRNGTRHLFVQVPAGMGSLRTTLAGGGATPGAGQIRFVRYDPQGLAVDDTSSLTCFDPDAGGGCGGGTPHDRSTTAPLAGIWEIVVEARRTSDAADAPFTLTVSIGHARITPRRDLMGMPVVGEPVSRAYTVTNGAAPVRARLQGGDLSSVRTLRPTIGPDAQQVRDIEVPAGSTSLSAAIGNPADRDADLDLFVYRCTSGTCVLAGQSADADSEEAVTVTNPAAGLWRVAVLGFGVPSGSTAYDLRDAVTSSAYGSVSIAHVPTDRAAGESWTVSGAVTAQSAPEDGRFFTGPLQVVTEGGQVLATGSVELTPPGAPTTTSVATSPSPSIAGRPVTVTATVAPGTVGGRVVFTADGHPLGSAPVQGDVATITTAALGVGSHAIGARLEATGPFRDSEAETVEHVVTAAPAAAVPDADAGDDQRAVAGATVTLDATGSTHPDDDALTYAWVQEAGPTVSLAGADTAEPTFDLPDTAEALTFRVVVTDPDGDTDSDTVDVTVNHAPVAGAGPDQEVNPGDTVTLDATSSSDPDDDALTHAWTQDDGTPVELAGADTAAPTFTAPTGPAVLTFTLTVTDEGGLAHTDQVVITVNGVPVADAGAAQTVEQGDTVTLDATASSDPDDDALTYAWVQGSGPTVELAGADTATPTFTAPPGPASLVFTVTATDGGGASATASVTITVVPPLTADEVWVVEVYSTFLHRVPDDPGLAYWSGRLGAGTSRADVVRSIALSPEATRGPVVTDLYDRLLDRDADPAERSYWGGRLVTGTRHHWVERTVLASPERHTASGGTDAAYVADLYQRVLGRTGEDDEIGYWVGRLGSGAPRLATVDALLNTSEARAVRVAQVAEEVLGRPATPTELADLGRAFARTRDPRTVAMVAFLRRDQP